MRFSERAAAANEAWADYCQTYHRVHDEPCERPAAFDTGFHMGVARALRDGSNSGT